MESRFAKLSFAGVEGLEETLREGIELTADGGRKALGVDLPETEGLGEGRRVGKEGVEGFGGFEDLLQSRPVRSSMRAFHA